MSDSLRSLSNQSLADSTRNAASGERRSTRVLLDHLVEIDRRKMHLELGYSSMFDYCTRDLGCSAGAAFRRIQTARCMARFPTLSAMLEKNEVNISTVAQISRVLLKSGDPTLLARIRHKSQREVDELLGEFRPVAPSRERVRAVVVVQPAGESPSMFAPAAALPRMIQADAVNCEASGESRATTRPQVVQVDAAQQKASCESPAAALPQMMRVDVHREASGDSPDACEKSAYFRSGTDSERSEQSAGLPRRIAINFTVQPEFMAAIDKIKALAWHRLPGNASLEQVLQVAMDYMIEKEDPIKRSQRRAQRAATPRQGPPSRTATPSTRARHIAAAVRDDVFVRDRGQCAYIGRDGKRCKATSGLQIDHVTPVAHGGRGESGNLRLLCAAHNRFESERMGLPRPADRTVKTQT
jgi:5-methylcytosine-specific restriction endonuclease McrA